MPLRSDSENFALIKVIGVMPTTAYNLVRQAGVAIGKVDYLGV